MKATLVSSGELVAVKTCKDTVADPARFLEEADMLKEFGHPNIVKLIGVVSPLQTTLPKRQQKNAIVLELCKDELLEYLRKHGSLLSVGTLVEWPRKLPKECCTYTTTGSC